MAIKADGGLEQSTASDGGGPDMRPVDDLNSQNSVIDGSGNYLNDLNNVNLLTAELASLIYGNLKGNYRKLLKADFSKIKILKKNIRELKSSNEKIVSEILDKPKLELKDLRNNAVNKIASGDIPSEGSVESFSLEDFLGVDVNEISISRIKELLSNELVKARFDHELLTRKENLETLERVKPDLVNLKNYEQLVTKAKKRVLELKVNAFKESRKLNVKEVSYIDSVRSKIAEIDTKIKNLLDYREIATAYRFEELLKFKKQFDTSGFIRTKSRQKIIEEVQDSILLGKNVLLTGATGTGKTVLAVAAVQEISKILNVGFENISGDKMAGELSNPKSKKEFDDFVEVFSGTPDAKASDFIAKQRLKSGPNGGTDTYTEIGKILKAFIDQKIPIIDEIDLIPNDTLMRIKHLFTKRPGDYYSPQEDGNTRYLLKTVNIIATANIKSAKHQDREELDPAIVRLFDNIHVNYLPKEEVEDFSLINLMDPAGFIYKVSLKELQNESSTLARLIYCLKKVEENYLGIGAGENISNKDKQFLKKAVLELGRFVGMFSGFSSSGMEFSDYIKHEVIDFITNMAYPKSDRLILTKIFSEKGFITKEDIGTDEKPGTLDSIMDDVSLKELNDNILVDSYKFDSDSRIFIDSFELASLDAFNTRKLSAKTEKFAKSEILQFLNSLDRFLQKSELEGKDNLESLINDILSNYIKGDHLEFPEDKKMPLVAMMYSLGLRDELLTLKKIVGFEELVTKIILIDSKQKKVFYNTEGELIPEKSDADNLV